MYMYSPALGASKSQLGDIYFIAVVLNCQHLLWLYVCIYIYIGSSHRVMLLLVFFLHVSCMSQQNSQRQFWSSVCTSFCWEFDWNSECQHGSCRSSLVGGMPTACYACSWKSIHSTRTVFLVIVDIIPLLIQLLSAADCSLFLLWFRWMVSTKPKNDEMHLSPFAGALWQIHDLFDLFESNPVYWSLFGVLWLLVDPSRCLNR